MLRVLQVYKDYSPVVGGIENNIKLLAEGLRSCGIDARVLVTNTSLKTKAGIINGVPVAKTGRLVNVSSAPVSPGMLPTLWNMEKEVDIAHLHLPYPPGELAQLLCGRSRRTVLTYHSDIVRQKALGALYSPFLRLMLQRADLIAVSNPAYIRSSQFLRTVAGKCRVVPFGIKLDRFDRADTNNEAVAEIRNRHGRPLILFVGRLRHYKGIDVLLHAMQQIDAHLLVVGVGPMADEWRSMSMNNGLSDKVTFAGELSDEELVNAYHAADLFVPPSTNRAETLGIVQLEAMACGLPVVCTELGTGTSFANQNGKTGFVVQPGDPDELAAAIRKLLDNDSLRYEMGRNAMARSRHEFSNKTMIARIINFYQEALRL